MDSEIKVEGVVGTDVTVEVVALSETVAESRTGDSPKTPPPHQSGFRVGGGHRPGPRWAAPRGEVGTWWDPQMSLLSPSARVCSVRE